MNRGPVDFTSILGGKGNNPMRDAVMKMAEDIEIHLEYKRLKATLDRGYFNDLLAEGFTDEQALEIGKSTNYNA